MNEDDDPPITEAGVVKRAEGAANERNVEVSPLIRQVMRFHRGPLPDGESFECYARLIPNGAERLMKLVENEATHRLAERMAQSKAIVRGQWIGCALTVFLAGGAFYLGATGNAMLAGVVFTTTIVAVVAVFVLGRRQPMAPFGPLASRQDDSSRM
jgi:uncharacterized membrane protein